MRLYSGGDCVGVLLTLTWRRNCLAGAGNCNHHTCFGNSHLSQPLAQTMFASFSILSSFDSLFSFLQCPFYPVKLSCIDTQSLFSHPLVIPFQQLTFSTFSHFSSISFARVCICFRMKSLILLATLFVASLTTVVAIPHRQGLNRFSLEAIRKSSSKPSFVREWVAAHQKWGKPVSQETLAAFSLLDDGTGLL